MEHAIGSIITLPDGIKVEVVEVSRTNGCRSCLFEHGKYNCCKSSMRDIAGPCIDMSRSDRKYIIYRKIK